MLEQDIRRGMSLHFTDHVELDRALGSECEEMSWLRAPLVADLSHIAHDNR